MKNPLRILHVEDSPKDAELVKAILEEAGIACDTLRVETRADYVSALEQSRFDLILGDYTMPGFDGLSALKIAQEKCSDVPFIRLRHARRRHSDRSVKVRRCRLCF